MYFQAETHGQKFEINVSEKKTTYELELKPEGGEWRAYSIPKKDYKYLDNSISFIFKNSSYLIDAVGEDTEWNVYTRGSYRSIKIYNEESLLHESLKAGDGFGAGSDLVAGMPGKIVKVMVEPGQKVDEGTPLLIMEAMKMENEMKADKEVTIDQIHVKAGDSVDRGDALISFEKQ